MDRIKFISFSGFLLFSFVPLRAAEQTALPSSDPEELVVRRTGASAVQVTQDGAEIPPKDIHIEVIPQGPEDLPLPGSKAEIPVPEGDQRELERWRLLSHQPIHLSVTGGLINVEWAGIKKSVPIEDGQLNIQLMPQ